MGFDQVIGVFLRLFAALDLGSSSAVYVTKVFEGFVTKLKLSGLVGFVLASPWWMFEVLAFVFPGLKKREKKILAIGLLASVILAVFGVGFGYTVILPTSLAFLTGAGFIPEQAGMMLSYEHSVFYVVKFLVYSVVMFQLPVVLELLMVFNVVNRKALFRASRYVIVVIFVLSAIVTPPDFISQIGLAGPLIVLYVVTILIAKLCKFGEG